MAWLPASRRLMIWAAPALLVAFTARALDDADHILQRERIAALADVQASLTVPLTPGEAPRSSAPVNEQALKQAIDAYRRGAVAEGDAIATSFDDPATRAMLEWAAIRFGGSFVSFNRINGFLQGYPNYPATVVFRRRAEAALISEKKSVTVIRSFFHAQRPITPVGRVALAIALKSEGQRDEALALIREVWRRDQFGQPLEAIVLNQFGDQLTATDHRLRTERYLFQEDNTAALRNATRVSPDYVLLAKARLASAQAKGTIAPSLIAAVPASLRNDVSFIFLQAQQARRANKFSEAAQLLAKVPRDPAQLGDGDEWWTERRLTARKLLDEGDAAKAYEVASGHGAESPAERIDAEWHAGWIALRYRDQPGLALAHFDEAAKSAETPISVSRVAYWQGRAAETIGLSERAQEAYERAAANPVAYYGQLARAKLGLADLPIRTAEPAGLDHLPGHQGVKLLYQIGARDLAATMLVDLAQRLHTTTALEAAAAIAYRENDVRTLLTIGKTALQRGFPLDSAAFPTSGVPDFPVLGDPMERAIVHAIARQESAFDPNAVSHAGARGLMQMMPATARETARRANLPFDLPRLGSDALYSAQMGAAHLNDLLREWRGSYVLTFAAYNAGSGNVRRWIEAYGDPRKPGVDAVDWVERISIYETRNYVQRVMENLQVYRQRLNQRTAYMIDYDLKRVWARD